MRSGDMYMMPLNSQYYALIPKRRWYAPWVWDLDCVEWLETNGLSDATPLASNLRRDEALGMMKMLGAYMGNERNTRDKFLGEQK